MKLVSSVHSAWRKCAIAGSLALTSAMTFAEGETVTTGFDLTTVGTQVDSIASAIVTFIQNTMIGKVALVAGAFLALRLVYKFIRFLAGR